jgi:hypothetical protein
LVFEFNICGEIINKLGFLILEATDRKSISSWK